MLSFIRRLLGAQDTRLSRPAEKEAVKPASFTGDAFYVTNSDILDGVEFSATLQLRTPLWILEHHGEVFSGPPSHAPDYGGPAHGIWLPKTKGELGAFLEQGRTHASDVGSVEPTAYLPFLKAFRAIVEGPGPLDAQLAAIKELPERSPAFAAFWKTLRTNYQDFPESFFYMQLTQLQGVGSTTAKRMYEAGLRSMDDVAAASDEQLLGIKGVGKGLVAKIRAASRPQG